MAKKEQVDSGGKEVRSLVKYKGFLARTIDKYQLGEIPTLVVIVLSYIFLHLVCGGMLALLLSLLPAAMFAMWIGKPSKRKRITSSPKRRKND